MRRRRRHRRKYKRNPIDSKVMWAVGLTALAAAAIGLGIYLVKKKELTAEQAPQSGPPGSGGTVAPSGGTQYPGPAPTSPGNVYVAKATTPSPLQAQSAMANLAQAWGVHAPKELHGPTYPTLDENGNAVPQN